jgi:hypothetical protein
MKTYGGVEVQLNAFLTKVLDGGEWSASRPRHFTPGKRAPVFYWMGGWMGSKAGLDAVVKTKFPFLTPAGSRTPVIQLITLSLY